MSENAVSKKEGNYSAIGFKHWFAAVLVVIIIAGILLYAVFRMCVFRVKSDLPQYNWSASDLFDASLYPSVSVGDDGQFTILQLTDSHFINGTGKSDRKTFDLMSALIEKSQPDLIVVTGDITFCVDNITPTQKFISFMEDICSRRGIKWAATFGNHDSTGFANKTKLAEMYAEAENCLFCIGPTNLNDDGKYGYVLGNYAVNLKNGNGDILCNLFMMDSNERGTDRQEGTYAPISNSTISWYEWFVEGQTQLSGRTIPSLAFFHIPLCEARDYLKNSDTDTIGFNENVASSDKNTGLFDKMLSLNSTVATFSGHDHQNYFEIDLNGILLANTVSCGYSTYGRDKYKGGRVIKLDLTAQNLIADTYILFASDVA